MILASRICGFVVAGFHKLQIPNSQFGILITIGLGIGIGTGWRQP